MIIVYVIRSLKFNYRYVGITINLSDRLARHNAGKNKSTKKRGPFELIYLENYSTYKEARTREKFLKSGIGRKFLNTLQS